MVSIGKLGLACLLASALTFAADVRVGLNSKGATVSPARAKPKDRIIWAGNNWRVEFKGRTPCQNGVRVFSSATANRICTISVTCNASDKSGCGRYKYDSSADGGPVIDPEIEVEPTS